MKWLSEYYYSLFCKHHWVIESTSFVSPEIFKDDHLPEGRTHVYLRCIDCKDLKSKTVYGKYQNRDKVLAAIPETKRVEA